MYARQAIATKYLGPTDHRGARIKATCDAKSITFGWNYELGTVENHAHAARMLATDLGWDGDWYMGSPTVTPGGYVFVNSLPETKAFRVKRR